MNFYPTEKYKWTQGYEIYGDSLKNLENILKIYSKNTGIPLQIVKYEFLKSRLEIIKELFKFSKNRLDENIILDVGCGNIFLLELIRIKSNVSLIGLDITDKVFKIKKDIISRDRIHVIVADAVNLPFKENIINGFISSEVLEHIPKKQDFFREIFRCLMNKSITILTTPNKNLRIWNFFNIFHLFKRVSKKKTKKSINNIQPFEKFIDSRWIVKILKEFKFNNIDIKNLFHHPGQSWFSFKSKRLNLILYNFFLKINPILRVILKKFGRLIFIVSIKK